MVETQHFSEVTKETSKYLEYAEMKMGNTLALTHGLCRAEQNNNHSLSWIKKKRCVCPTSHFTAVLKNWNLNLYALPLETLCFLDENQTVVCQSSLTTQPAEEWCTRSLHLKTSFQLEMLLRWRCICNVYNDPKINIKWIVLTLNSEPFNIVVKGW